MSNQFDLVMITDYMLESLVLLRHHLCMSLDDISFFSKNVADSDSHSAVYERTKQRIKSWQHLDTQVGRES